MASHHLRLRRALSLSYSLLERSSHGYRPHPFSSISTSRLIPPSSAPAATTQLMRRTFTSTTTLLNRKPFDPATDEIGPDTILFEGCDYKHWLITVDFPRDANIPREQMIETYVNIAAQVFGSEEEAKKKIYALSTTTYQGFQVECSEATSEKFKSIPQVVFVLPDSYIDPEKKEYGGDKYVNGEIFPRPPPVHYGRTYNSDRRPRERDGMRSQQNYGPPQKNLGPPPPQNYGQPPRQNLGQPPQQNYEQPPRQNLGQPPQQNYEQPPRQNLGQPPQQNYEQPPRQNLGQPPQQNYEQPPRQNLGQPPRQNYGPSPQQNFGPPPQQNFGPPPQQNFGPSPQQNYGSPSYQKYASPQQQSYKPPQPHHGYGSPPLQGYPSTPGSYGNASNIPPRLNNIAAGSGGRTGYDISERAERNAVPPYQGSFNPVELERQHQSNEQLGRKGYMQDADYRSPQDGAVAPFQGNINPVELKQKSWSNEGLGLRGYMQDTDYRSPQDGTMAPFQGNINTVGMEQKQQSKEPLRIRRMGLLPEETGYGSSQAVELERKYQSNEQLGRRGFVQDADYRPFQDGSVPPYQGSFNPVEPQRKHQSSEPLGQRGFMQDAEYESPQDGHFGQVSGRYRNF